MSNKDYVIMALRQEKERYHNNYIGIDLKYDRYRESMSEYGKAISAQLNEWLNNILEYIEEIDGKLQRLGADLSV